MSSFSLSRNSQQLPTPWTLDQKEPKVKFPELRWRWILIWEKESVIYGVLLLCKIQDKYAYNTKRARKRKRKNNKRIFLDFILHDFTVLLSFPLICLAASSTFTTLTKVQVDFLCMFAKRRRKVFKVKTIFIC